MSAQSMSEQGDVARADSGPAPAVLQFTCTSCGKELSAPSSAAGVTAPCPICGAITQAPEMPMPPARSGPETKPESAVVPAEPEPEPEVVATVREAETTEVGLPATTAAEGRERGAPAMGQAEIPEESPRQGHSPAPRRRSKQPRKKGAMDPITGLSAGYEDRKELGALIRIVLAVALTVAITMGVFYFMERTIQGPKPSRFSSP